MQEIDTIVYAGRLKNKMELMNSSSGGAFIIIMQWYVRSMIMKVMLRNFI